MSKDSPGSGGDVVDTACVGLLLRQQNEDEEIRAQRLAAADLRS